MGSSSAALPQMSLPSKRVLGLLDMTILRTCANARRDSARGLQSRV
jgi:hypothetical protein